MAQMWPREIPGYLLRDSRRSTEVQVFNTLKKNLDDSWAVYYSRPWWGMTPTGGEAEGEADFILVHPIQGILFLEVKGGAISWSPEVDEWYSTDRNGVRHRIKDPVAQASTCKHRFLARFKKSPSWPKVYVRARHAVLFPHTARVQVDTIGKYESEIFGFQNEMSVGLKPWILERLSSHSETATREVGPGTSGFEVIRNNVAGEVELKISLASAIDADLTDAEILLTGSQLFQLRAISKEPRTLLEGPAGTGKTLLGALWLQRDTAPEPFGLYVAKSLNLVANFERHNQSTAIKACTFQSLMAVGSLAKLGQISKLVIDEMQDLDHGELDQLRKILDENKIKFLGLMDSNQAIYNNPSTVAARLAAESKLLDINLRNSVEIGKLADALYSGPPAELAGPPGVGVHISPSTGKDVAGDAKENLVNLQKEGVPSSYITILCSDDDSVHALSKELNHMGIETRQFAEQGDGVIVESVSNFKGLESPVILIVADRNLSQSRELSYVAVSRARSSLYILGRFANTVLDNAIRQTQAKQDISPHPAS